MWVQRFIGERGCCTELLTILSERCVDTSEATLFAIDLLPGQKAPFYIDFAPENSVTGDQSWVPSVTNVTVLVILR